MPRQPIQTDAAPSAIGPYSQAIQADNTVYLSGQIPLVPETMTLVEGDIDAQIRQVLDNLAAVAAAAGASLDRIVKLNVYMTDLGQFPSRLYRASVPGSGTSSINSGCGKSATCSGICRCAMRIAAFVRLRRYLLASMPL